MYHWVPFVGATLGQAPSSPRMCALSDFQNPSLWPFLWHTLKREIYWSLSSNGLIIGTFFRWGKRQELTVREKSCSIAIVITPTSRNCERSQKWNHFLIFDRLKDLCQSSLWRCCDFHVACHLPGSPWPLSPQALCSNVAPTPAALCTLGTKW